MFVGGGIMIKKFKSINKAYKFRIYPRQEQKELIDKTVGCSRFIYNEFLAKAKEYGYQSYTKYSSQLPQLKKEYTWLKEVDSIVLQQSLKDLDTAFKNFFSGKYNYPKFKSKKKSRLSYRTQKFIRPSGSTNIEIKDNKARLWFRWSFDASRFANTGLHIAYLDQEASALHLNLSRTYFEAWRHLSPT